MDNTGSGCKKEVKVLVVDDMAINLGLVEGILEALNIHTELANNGKEALDMIYAGEYDLVFMDIMMPVMNGMEAVKKLRSGEDERCLLLPVIAMTSDVTPEVEEELSKNGFSGYISKPVDISDIITCINTWLPGVDTVMLAEKPRSEEDLEITDRAMNTVIPGIDNATGIKNSGGALLYLELLEEVYGIIDEKCDAMRKHLEEYNISGFTTDVHALKTTCRLIGAMKLSEDFYMLEKCGCDNDIDKIKAYAPDIIEDFRSLKSHLEPFAKNITGHVKEYQPEEIITMLNGLSVALNDYDIDTAEKIITELKLYELPDNIKDHISTLDKLIYDLEYDMAIENINSIKCDITQA